MCVIIYILEKYLDVYVLKIYTIVSLEIPFGQLFCSHCILSALSYSYELLILFINVLDVMPCMCICHPVHFKSSCIGIIVYVYYMFNVKPILWNVT